MKKEIIFLLFFLAIGLTSCHKDYPEPSPYRPIDYTVLPPITQTGANTFGCLVDGEVWVPRVELLAPWYDKAVNFNERKGTGTGIISCRLLNKTTDDFFTIAFAANYFQATSYNTLGDSTNIFWFNPDFRQGSEDFEHINGDTTNYLKIIAIDTAKNYISGVFKCTLYNNNKTANLKITEGRFDLQYSAQ